MADAFAPKHHTNRSADRIKCFAAGYGQTDLNSFGAGNKQMPQFPPQEVEFFNATAAAVTGVSFRDEYLTDNSITVPANGSVKIRCPVLRLNASVAGISAIAYWWMTPCHEYDEQRVPTLGAA